MSSLFLHFTEALAVLQPLSMSHLYSTTSPAQITNCRVNVIPTLPVLVHIFLSALLHFVH